MSLSGGRSSVKGISDLSGISPLLLELAGLKQKNSSPGRAVGKASPGITNGESVEMLFSAWGV